MNDFKFFYLKVAVILLLLSFCSCQFTQTYNPDFNNTQKDVLTRIKTNYGFTDIKFQGKKQSGSSGQHSILTVKLINGKNIPTDTPKMTALLTQLGTQIKSTLKNPKEFDTYVIVFDTIVVNGDVTNENYTGHEFKAEEL